MIMQGAEAFFLPGGSRGVLLLHGFTGSPAELRPLGDGLAAAGYTVLAVRLPGHGTSPEDLERMTKEDWQRAVLDGYDILSGQCEEIFVCGLSMGGWLAVWLATVRKVAGLVTMSTPVFLYEAGQLHRLPPKERCMGHFLPRPHKAYPGMAAKYLVCYHVMPFRSIHEMLAVIDQGKEVLPQVTAPLLVVQSKKDHTVKAESGQFIVDNCGSREKRLLLLEESGHRVTLDSERELVAREVSDFFNSNVKG